MVSGRVSKDRLVKILNKSILTKDPKYRTAYRIAIRAVELSGSKTFPVQASKQGGVNIGFLMEALIKRALGKPMTLSHKGQPDIIYDNAKYEIKCSLGCKSYNTPITNNTTVLLVNRLGVFLVTPSNFVANGVFDYNKPYGLRLPTLSKQLGL